jgi:hypothetical protein
MVFGADKLYLVNEYNYVIHFQNYIIIFSLSKHNFEELLTTYFTTFKKKHNLAQLS